MGPTGRPLSLGHVGPPSLPVAAALAVLLQTLFLLGEVLVLVDQHHGGTRGCGEGGARNEEQRVEKSKGKNSKTSNPIVGKFQSRRVEEKKRMRGRDNVTPQELVTAPPAMTAIESAADAVIGWGRLDSRLGGNRERANSITPEQCQS